MAGDPNIFRPRPRLRGLGALVLAAALGALLLSVLAVSFFASSVQREVDALAVANSDTTQWTLVQAEVELMALLVAAHQAHETAADELAEVRKRFDVLYSRVQLIEESRQFADLREEPAVARNIATLKGFLDRYTAVVDGPDPGLFASLPVMVTDLNRLRATARDFSLLGVRFYAEDSDRKRTAVATMLTRIGHVTLALVLALLSGIAVLLWLYRRSIRSERAAAEARDRLEEVIATSLDGIIATDAEGRIIEYNSAAERLFGYTRAEAMGRDMGELVIPEPMRAAHAAGLKRHRLSGQKPLAGRLLERLEAQRKDGTKCLLEISLSSGTYDGKHIYVSFLRDITDRVAAEEELIRTRDSALAGERAKAGLLAVMSHEMRTPLNGILGTIELLQHTRLSARQERLLTAMKTSAGLLLHHVNGVLSMSRAEAGQLELVTTEIDPGALVQELVDSQRPAIEAQGNRVRCDVRTAPRQIWGDALRLRQVILNLVGNANKFTRNGEILVDCDMIPERNEVEFRVTDTGIGIEERDLDRIFEEFRTLDTSYSRQAEGTGLGLAIARRLVTAMGGEIGVASEPGEGSLFWVRLPVGAPVSPAAGPDADGAIRPEVQVPALGGLRVLLVEDNPINRLVAREMLHAAGHEVVEAVDGREGVRIAAAERFDAILMDISMPEMDGVAATRTIRGQEGPNRAAPIIALTAHALPEDTGRFLAAGITETLVKPLSMAALQRALTGAGDFAAESRAVIASTFCDLSAKLGQEKAARLIERFTAEAEALVARTMAPEWAATPPVEKAEAVHRLAGSAAVLGAGQLRRALQDLETACRRGDAGAEARGLAELAAAWTLTQTEIRSCLEILTRA